MPDAVLGISAFYHDSAACLVRDGQIVAAAQEERFSRRKHDHRFPHNAVAYCLDAAGYDPRIGADIRRAAGFVGSAGGDGDEEADDVFGLGRLDPDELVVAFYDKPWLKFERLLETYVAFAPKGLRSFLASMPLWLKEKLWMDQTIKRAVGYEGQVYYPEHHQSHAASAFLASPFERAAVLTMDGVGEWATASWGVGSGTSVTLSHELRFPHSLGLLYTAFTYYTGFRVNSGEYKVMGLAPYGEPRFADLILEHLVDLKDDGSFRLDQRYFNYCTGLTMTSPEFHALFGGEPRRPESEISQRDMDLAASVQKVVEIVVSRMARHVRRETGERKLCLAGGVALNCVANGKVLREGTFDDVWIQPAAGDAGGALGAALHVWHDVLGNPRTVDGRTDRQHRSLLGPSYSNDSIKSWLESESLPFYRPATDAERHALIAELIDAGNVVGHFEGRMEFGPRALGSRSILGDPRSPKMQSLINLKIKYRESFRPFAPAVLEEHASDYFDLDVPSPYMLLVAPVAMERRTVLGEEGKAERFGLDRLHLIRSEIPAVTHVDYSARVQTVDETSNAGLRGVLEAFYERTGCPVLINTSFNVRGEPIVCTPQDAYACFMRTEMDVLVLENCILRKEEQPAVESAPLREQVLTDFNPD